MKKLGLIGHNISHSKSPKLHQIIGDYFNRTIQYQLLDIDSKEKLKLYINDLKAGIYHGFNITIPYKEAVIPLLDQLTPQAQKVGAVNTIYIKDGKVIGDNTDYDGFKYLFDEGLKLNPIKDIIILGSGGAAKAVFAVCQDLGYRPTVISRTPKISPIFGQMKAYEDIPNLTFDLVIQTTPIGTYPNIDDTPLDTKLVEEKFVIDLIYNPNETKLMQHAKQSLGGLDMLIVQAIKAQNIWFEEDKNITSNILEYMKEHLNE